MRNSDTKAALKSAIQQARNALIEKRQRSTEPPRLLLLPYAIQLALRYPNIAP